MVRVLIFRPNFELATSYGHAWLGRVRDIAENLGHTVLDLEGEEATPENFYNALENFKPEIVIAMGHGNCYSEDTEILTENGWKKFYELQPREKVATLNPKTDELEYQIPTAYFKFRYKGKMFHINGRSINLLVTPNHKLYVSLLTNKGLEWSPFRFIEAKDIGKKGVTIQLVRNDEVKRRIKLREKAKKLELEKKWSLSKISEFVGIPKSTVHAWLHKNQDPRRTTLFKSTGTTSGNLLKFKRGAKWNCEVTEYFVLPSVEIIHRNRYGVYGVSKIQEKLIKIQDWLRFFGIWIAEGSASRDSDGRYIISITQMNNEKRRKIKKWVDRVGEQVGFSAWEEASNEHSKCVKFKNKQVYEYLKQFGHSKDKFIPKEIKMLPPDLLKILLDAMMLGDGYLNSYSTSSKRLADDVQEIAMKLGKGATISKNKRTGVYTVNITNGEVCVIKKSMTWEDYDGYVYCVQVPNHLLYVRRKGKACWCGNSTTFTGQDARVVFKSCENDGLMTGTQAYFLSCLMGQTLAKTMDEKNAVTVAGYITEFVWVVHPDYTDDPINDPRAYPFMRAVVESCGRLLSGGSWRDFYNTFVRMCDLGVSEWFNSTDPTAPQIVAALEQDRDSLVIYGEALIRPVPRFVVVVPDMFMPVAVGVTLISVFI